MSILQWLASNDTGMSSKTIALTALGEMPNCPSHPHDGDDFGRCYRLLLSCPEAIVGLHRLGESGGPVWQALVPKWAEIEAAYLRDMEVWRTEGNTKEAVKKMRCYDLMRSIIDGAKP